MRFLNFTFLNKSGDSGENGPIPLRTPLVRRAGLRRGVALVAALAVLSAGLIYYFSTNETHDHAEGPEILYYTCSMHPHIKSETPGFCPICHMRLTPVYKTTPGAAPPAASNAEATDGAGTATPQAPGVFISAQRHQMIGVASVAVQMAPAVREIETTGRVAFDPELAVAVTEYVQVQGDPELRRSAYSRLKLLGMGDEEIRQIGRYGARAYEGLYLPGRGGPAWVYATVYEQDLPYIKPGQSVNVRISGDDSRVFTGSVRSVAPIFDATTRTTRARITLPANAELVPNAYVDVTFRIDLGEKISVPFSAVVDTGSEQLVFVVGADNLFTPRRVRLGPQTADGYTILEGLSAGERVVSAATFLVDSESRLKAGVSPEHNHKTGAAQ